MGTALSSIGLGQSINLEDVARLSPLGHSHINRLLAKVKLKFDLSIDEAHNYKWKLSN